MKFKSSIIEIKKAIKVLTPIVNYNHSVLAFRYLLLREKNGRMEIKAFDDYTVGSSFFSYYENDGDKTNSIYILAKQFMSLINNLGYGDAIIEIKDGKCIIKRGKSRYSLSSLEESVAKDSLKTVDIDYYEVDPKLKVKIGDFNACYNSISHCISTDSSQRNLQCVFVKDNKMIACDGVRGAVVDFNSESMGNGLSFHKKACMCLSNMNNTGEIGIYVSGTDEDQKLYGVSDNFIFVTSTLGEFPYDSIEPIISGFGKDFSVSIEIDPDEIVDNLNRVLMFADTDTYSVSISVSDDFRISVENQSSAEEIINTFKNVKGNDFSIMLDGKSLSESLSKSLSDTVWSTNGEEEVQYISDGSLLQFFMGLSS